MRLTSIYKKRKRTHLFTSINITPLTDIALVLLVIFMIATPMLIQSKIKLELPKVEANKNKVVSNNNLLILIDARGRIYLNDKKIKFRDLRTFIQGFALKQGNKLVSLNADKNVKYDKVAQVLNLLQEYNLKNIDLGIDIK